MNANRQSFTPEPVREEKPDVGRYANMSREEFIAHKRIEVSKRMDVIDNLTEGQRQLVHEIGWCTVKAFMQAGITSPRKIRGLVSVVIHELSVVGRIAMEEKS